MAAAGVARAFRSWLADAGAVVATAARLFARHWPVLLALAMAGRAARELVMFVAVHASALNGVLGGLVFVLVPVAALAALVLMLRVVQASLPRLGTVVAQSAAPAPARRLFDHVGSVLVPFLAVYASYGYLKKDGAEYLYRVFQDEVMGNAALLTAPSKVDVKSRLPFTIGVVLVSTIAVTLVLRWLLGRWEGRQQRRWAAVAGGYLEVTWIVLAARGISQFKKTWTDWLEERRIVRWIETTWDQITEAVGRLGRPMKALTSWLGDVVGSLDMLIVVPIAWLAVGAVIYGFKAAAPPPPSSGLYQRAARRLSAGPRPLRRATTEVAGELRSKFGPLLQGLGLILRAGLRPMLLFWLAFLIAQSGAQWLWELERAIIGPQDVGVVWSPLSSVLGVVNEAAGNALLVCLLAAAVDRAFSVEPVEPVEPEPPL
jgi:hypothetical protein